MKEKNKEIYFLFVSVVKLNNKRQKKRVEDKGGFFSLSLSLFLFINSSLQRICRLNRVLLLFLLLQEIT